MTAPRVALVVLVACGTPVRAAPRDGGLGAIDAADAAVDAVVDAPPDTSPFGVLMSGEPLPPGPDLHFALRGHRNPELRVSAAIIGGQIEGAIVRRYLRRHRTDALVCYLARLAVAPNLLPGSMIARFKVEARGAITEASVIGFDPHVSDCVAQRLEAIELPKFKGDGHVTITFTVEIE